MKKLNAIFIEKGQKLVREEWPYSQVAVEETETGKVYVFDHEEETMMKEADGVGSMKVEKGRNLSSQESYSSDFLNHFNRKYKYSELSKIVEHVSRFKANIWRDALTRCLEKSEVQAIHNYDWYGNRTPVEYNLYQKEYDGEEIEGLLDGTVYLELAPGGEENRIVLQQYETWTGSLVLNAYGPDRTVLRNFYRRMNQWMKTNNFLKGQKIDSTGKFIKLNGEKWEDFTFSDDLEKKINKHIFSYINRFEELTEKKLPTSRGFLLHGKPGNGKTSLGRIIANNVDATFIWVPFSRDGDTDYSDIYALARELSPSIVFLEDLMTQGGMDRRNGFSSTLGTLLNVLSGIESNAGVITFATDNYVETIDVALKRAGRFDYIWALPDPDEASRLKFLTKYLTEFPPYRIEALAKGTEGFSCANLRELTYRLIILDEAPEEDAAIIKEMVDSFGITADQPAKPTTEQE